MLSLTIIVATVVNYYSSSWMLTMLATCVRLIMVDCHGLVPINMVLFASMVAYHG